MPLRTRTCGPCWQRAQAPVEPVQLELPGAGERGRPTWSPARRPGPLGPCTHVVGADLADLSPSARVGRKLPGDAVARVSRLAVPVDLFDGRVGFEAAPGAYGALPVWHSREAWMGAVKLHPRLLEACARLVKPALFLEIMRELISHADPATGREIAVVHADVAAAVGVCTKTVQRACTIGYRLGVLHLVAAGGEMGLIQRSAVLEHHRPGQSSRTWRKLPNFYAAVMPAQLAALTRPESSSKTAAAAARQTATQVPAPVDGAAGRRSVVHPPVGVPAGSVPHVDLEERSFTQSCGQPTSRPPNAKPGQETAAARPKQERQRGRPGPVVEPALLAYAAALRATLPGYRRLSLYRVGPALRCYHDGGLSPDELVAGLNTYLRASGHTWITTWDTRNPAQRVEQARYLVGMLTKARRAGHLIPDPTPAPAQD